MERYVIELKGHLKRSWNEWMSNTSVELLPDGNTRITGEIRDRSALYAVINRIRDLGITLVKLEKLKSTKE